MSSAFVSQTFPIVESCLGSPWKIPFLFVPLRKDPDGTQSPTGGLLKIIEARSSITVKSTRDGIFDRTLRMCNRFF